MLRASLSLCILVLVQKAVVNARETNPMQGLARVLESINAAIKRVVRVCDQWILQASFWVLYQASRF